MANVNPPVKNQAWSCDWSVEDYANPGKFKDNPTLAAGDVQVSKDNGAYANLTTLPSAAPAGSENLNVVTTATEMNADKVTIRFRDQTAPPEWSETKITILTTTA